MRNGNERKWARYRLAPRPHLPDGFPGGRPRFSLPFPLPRPFCGVAGGFRDLPDAPGLESGTGLVCAPARPMPMACTVGATQTAVPATTAPRFNASRLDMPCRSSATSAPSLTTM